LRDRESEGPIRRAIDILCDLHCVFGFVSRFAQQHGYEMTERERDLIAEAERMVDAHVEKRKPVLEVSK
jgi:hypothetical protein